MTTSAIRPGEGQFSINLEQPSVSEVDQTTQTRALGILGERPFRDIFIASLQGGLVGALSTLAVLVLPDTNHGQTALTGCTAGFIGGATGAAIACIAQKILVSRPQRAIYQEMIPALLGGSLFILSISNAISWHYYHKVLGPEYQIGFALCSMVPSAVFTYLTRAKGAGFFLGLGTGSAIGFGVGAGVGSALSTISASRGAVYGSWLGTLGFLGAFGNCN